MPPEIAMPSRCNRYNSAPGGIGAVPCPLAKALFTGANGAALSVIRWTAPRTV